MLEKNRPPMPMPTPKPKTKPTPQKPFRFTDCASI